MLSASAIILAGGQSRRMGRPKAAIRFGNSTILEQLIAELCSSFEDILIIAAPARSEAFSIEHLLRAVPSSVRLVRDRSAYKGAAVALARGLMAAANDGMGCRPIQRVRGGYLDRSYSGSNRNLASRDNL